jgi:hypothetical protein
VVNGRFDGWIEGNAVFSGRFVELSRLVGVPGTARHAITVGAYVMKNEWIDIDDNPLRWSGLTYWASWMLSPALGLLGTGD